MVRFIHYILHWWGLRVSQLGPSSLGSALMLSLALPVATLRSGHSESSGGRTRGLDSSRHWSCVWCVCCGVALAFFVAWLSCPTHFSLVVTVVDFARFRCVLFPSLPGHVAQHPEAEWVVSMSFIQIYLETIQDLFAPETYAGDGSVPENLAVREDPNHGFYVEGLHVRVPLLLPAVSRFRCVCPRRNVVDICLSHCVLRCQEYVVRNFVEAVELLNWGLENRVMGCTKMNATSSRSHTVLTVSVRSVA